MSARASFAIYDIATGDIRVVVTCIPELAPHQCRPGENFTPCAAGLSDRDHRVVDGVIVARA